MYQSLKELLERAGLMPKIQNADTFLGLAKKFGVSYTDKNKDIELKKESNNKFNNTEWTYAPWSEDFTVDHNQPDPESGLFSGETTPIETAPAETNQNTTTGEKPWAGVKMGNIEEEKIMTLNKVALLNKVAKEIVTASAPPKEYVEGLREGGGEDLFRMSMTPEDMSKTIDEVYQMTVNDNRSITDFPEVDEELKDLPREDMYNTLFSENPDQAQLVKKNSLAVDKLIKVAMLLKKESMEKLAQAEEGTDYSQMFLPGALTGAAALLGLGAAGKGLAKATKPMRRSVKSFGKKMLGATPSALEKNPAFQKLFTDFSSGAIDQKTLQKNFNALVSQLGEVHDILPEADRRTLALLKNAIDQAPVEGAAPAAAFGKTLMDFAKKQPATTAAAGAGAGYLGSKAFGSDEEKKGGRGGAIIF